MPENKLPPHIRDAILSEPPNDHEIRYCRIRIEIPCRLCGGDGQGVAGSRWHDKCSGCERTGWRQYTITADAFLAAFAEDDPPADGEP